MFYTLHLRLTQFQLENGVYECIASNLDKEEFPPEKIKELYHMRWGIETSFRELKYTIGLTNLHSKNVEYICQEIYAKLILYNFCEIILANIILEERNRKYTYQLNYTMAIQICRHYLRQTFVTIDVEGLIKKELSPQRPHRQYQRELYTQHRGDDIRSLRRPGKGSPLLFPEYRQWHDIRQAVCIQILR